MCASADDVSPVDVAAPSRKRGRPPEPRPTYTTQDMHGHVSKRVLSPFRVSAPGAKRVRAADQQEDTGDLNMASASTPLPAALNDHGVCRSPELSPGLASVDDGSPGFDLMEAQEKNDICSYARQLSGYLGIAFQPLHVHESSDRQAVFCFPDWDQKGSQLSLKSFHLPGLRLALSADGEQLTWWCDCHHTLESARNMFANTDYPEQPSDWLEGRADKCLHIKALEVYSAAQLVSPPKPSSSLLLHNVRFLQMQLHWQNASVRDMAAKTPDKTLKARHSSDTL